MADAQVAANQEIDGVFGRLVGWSRRSDLVQHLSPLSRKNTGGHGFTRIFTDRNLGKGGRGVNL
jgi:hypothetical protein